MFSIANQAKIRNGASPTVDADWIKHNSTHAPYKDDVLVHHHKYQGKVATAIPSRAHNEYSQVLHPFNRGNKYTKYLKGKFGFKSKHGIGGVKKLTKGLMIVGTLMGVSQVMAGDPVGAVDPFGITIAGEQALQAMDDEMLEFAITQGYSEVAEYMDNCLSCPSFGMYYLSGEEAILFLSGQLNLNEIEHFTSDFFSSQEEANEFYDGEKSIEYAVPTEDGIPVGAIDVEKKGSDGSN